jgi:hypothetical protein
MGDSHKDPLRVDFDRQIKLEFHGSTVTSDAGLLAYRELDDALKLTSTATHGLQETRTGQNTQHSLLALLRQSLYSRLAGYEDVNDAERLCLDPALRTVVGGRAKDTKAASTSEMARFETETLSDPVKLPETLQVVVKTHGSAVGQANGEKAVPAGAVAGTEAAIENMIPGKNLGLSYPRANQTLRPNLHGQPPVLQSTNVLADFTSGGTRRAKQV